jgi:sterol desaturase/sphingolipid hydroxylase (fatty acid hydroxylase superfamily)
MRATAVNTRRSDHLRPHDEPRADELLRLPSSRLRAGLLIGAALIVVSLEMLSPLRRRQREPKTRHTARNLVVAALAATTVQLLEEPIVQPLARVVHRRRWGLLKRRALPRWLEIAGGVVLLDYTLYLWHVLVHRVPALWRFHAVHHVDLDLDGSTAVRFHLGELAISVPWRAAQIAAIGVAPRTLAIWQTATLLSVLFHHSNVRLPPRAERLLQGVVMTPHLHGIHHSIEPDEVNANWSSGLSMWDRLHGTLKADVDQDQITIGVRGHLEPADVTLPRILTLPFRDPTLP